jgi:hypothetical protein
MPLRPGTFVCRNAAPALTASAASGVEAEAAWVNLFWYVKERTKSVIGHRSSLSAHSFSL